MLGERTVVENGPLLTSFADHKGAWFTAHTLNPISNEKLVGFLRETHRICWVEIYLKLAASSADPFLCSECDHYFTLTSAATCYYHPENSKWDVLRQKRVFACCGYEFDF
jgi:hypothetical protein